MTISGTSVTATSAGTATLTATIADGTAAGTDYTQNFEIVFSVPDTRVDLAAGAAVTAAHDAVTADVEFTGTFAATLGVTGADFEVTGGATIGNVTVAEDLITVTVNFSANSGTDGNLTYVVSIASGSALIKGSATVTITHEADL